jgi:hypothetical protein
MINLMARATVMQKEIMEIILVKNVVPFAVLVIRELTRLF